MICPPKKSKSWKNFVSRVGNADIAHTIFFLRDGDIEDITDEEIASYVTPQDITPTISYKPIEKDLFEYNQDFEKISKVLSNLDVNKTLLDFITPSTIESTLQNAGFNDEMVTQLTDFYNSNRDLMYSAPNIYEVVNAYVSSKIPFGRTEIVKRADKELENKLLKWLEPLNISVKDLNDFKKNLNVNALGIADIINKTIYLAKERQIDTLPEEVAHFYVEFLEKRNKKGQSRNYLLYDDLINKIESWSEYQKYYDEYSKIYTKDGIVNIEKVKKEIIGKAIAEAVVRRFETKDLGLYSLIQEIIDYLRSIFKSRPLLNIQSLADDIAEKILSEDYSDIKKDLSEDVKLRDYKSVPKEVRDIIHNISSAGATMTGSVALRKAGTVYREDGEEFHDLDFKVSPTINRESFLNKIKKIYPSLTLKSEFQSGSSYTTLWNITVDGKIYDIDFFFETKPYNKLDNFVHWADTFAAKLDLGRAKDVTDFINYKPYKKFSLFPKKDVVIDDYLYYQTESLPSFKPVTLLTLSPLKQIDFRESLKVGNKLTFNYWDEGEQIEKSETDFVVEQIGKNNFTGTSANGTNTISYSDVIDTSIDRTLSPNDRRIFFENLAVGKFVKLNTVYGPIEGIVSSFDNERFTVGENIIKYSEIYKSNEIIDFELRLQELRRTLNNQLLVTKNIKTAEQKRRVDSLREALDNLNKYGGNLEDLHSLFVTMRDNFKRVKATLNNISKDSREMTPEKILYTISYAKNYIDSFTGLRSINTSIQNFEGSKELKAASASLVAELTNVQDEYFEIAIPKLAEVLWKQFNPKINKQLEKVKKDPWTLERLIQELRNPTRDIDALNTYFVAPINSNDIIVSLFTKVLKFAREKARALDEKLLRNITPLIDRVKAKMDINEAMKSFYTEVDMQVVENGEEKTIRVRKFVDKHNTDTWYNTTNLIYQERQMLYDQLSIAKTENNIPQIQNLSALIRGLNRRLQMFRESNGIQITGEKFKVEMERYKEFDEPKFWKFLDSYYKRVELDQTNNSTISVKNEETGEIDYYNYSGNRWVPNLELFLTKEYQALERGDKDVFELYKFVKDEYDKANYKIPMSYRLHNVVPSMYEKNFLDSVQKSAQNFFEDNNKQYLVRMDGRAYKEIPIGFTKILDVSKSDSNILRSTLMFITEANNYATMNEQYGSVDAITQILANNNPLDETQKKRIQSEINNRKEAIKKIIKQTYYGEKNATHGMAGKTIDALSKFTSLTRLALKPLNWVSNFLRGNFENMSEAIGGRHYNLSDLKWANKEFIKLQAKNPQKLSNMIRSLDAVQGRFMKSFGDEFMSFKEKYANMDVLFLGQDLGEVQIQGTAMLALLKAWNVQIPEDGNFDMDNLPEYFVDTLHAINKHNHGVYNDFDRLYAQDNALFRLFLQFRKYIVPTFRARYSGIFSGEYRVDFEAGTVERGYYREFGEYIYNSFKNFESLPNMIASFKTLNPVQQEGVRRTIVDLVGFFGFIVMSSLFKPGDDEEEDDSIVSDIRWHIAYQFARLKGDLGTYIPIFGTKDQLRIINNPFAAVPVISDIFNLFAALGDISPDKNGNWWLAKEYLRNTATRQKGELKIFGVLSKLNPLDNVLETFFPEEMYDKFDKASQR